MTKSLAKISVICFSVLILSIIGFYFSQKVLASPGLDPISYYNTSNATRTSMYWASPAGRTPWGGTNASAEQYTNASTDNTQYAEVCSDKTNDEPYWRFNFTIEENIANIQWINLTFNGYENAVETATCYYYNYTLADFTSIGIVPDSDGTISVNLTNGFSNIINSDKQLVMYCEGDSYDSGDCIYTDYATAIVGYTEAVPCAGSISNTTIEFPDASPGDSIEPVVQSSVTPLKVAINVSITQGTNCKVGFYAKDYFNGTSQHSFNPNTYEKYTVNPAGNIDWGSISTYVPVGFANIIYPASCSGQNAPFNCSFYFNLTIPSGQFPSDYNKTAVFTIESV